MSQILYNIELSFHKLRFFIVIERKVLRHPYLERIDLEGEQSEPMYITRSSEQKKETRDAIRLLKRISD